MTSSWLVCRHVFRISNATCTPHTPLTRSCTPLTRLFHAAGRLENAALNVMNAATSAAAFGAEGLLITDWGDGGHLQVDHPQQSLGPLNEP